ncbi:MAG TPA: hypothetical protein VH092_22425 [Urbifossiella sp.]|nr:hypothetical protein [Urbifossiella sp.]
MKCPCGVPAVLYWIDDETWGRAAHAASPPPVGHLCTNCTGREIGRPLTLKDLRVEFYKKTMPLRAPDFMREYVRATVAGAAVAAGQRRPAHWTPPETVGIALQRANELGAALAKDTPDAAAVTDWLAAEVDRHFPG